MPKEFDATKVQNQPLGRIESGKSDGRLLSSVKEKLGNLAKGAGDLGNTITSIPGAVVSEVADTKPGKAVADRTLDKVGNMLKQGYAVYKDAAPEIQNQMRGGLQKLADLGTYLGKQGGKIVEGKKNRNETRGPNTPSAEQIEGIANLGTLAAGIASLRGGGPRSFNPSRLKGNVVARGTAAEGAGSTYKLPTKTDTLLGMREAGVSPKMASSVADVNKGVNFGKLDNTPVSKMGKVSGTTTPTVPTRNNRALKGGRELDKDGNYTMLYGDTEKITVSAKDVPRRIQDKRMNGGEYADVAEDLGDSYYIQDDFLRAQQKIKNFAERMRGKKGSSLVEETSKFDSSF